MNPRIKLVIWKIKNQKNENSKKKTESKNMKIM